MLSCHGRGVVLATSGPGATNLVTGLMEAEMDKVALLAITGMKPTSQLGYAEFQDVNKSRLISSAGIEVEQRRPKLRWGNPTPS
jgi:thiamine pyrophosphate-dependent acetolactate synthase large subunit-like protein